MGLFLKNLQDTKICETIKIGIPEIYTCCSYPRMRCELVAPACFVEVSEFDLGSNPGTEELAVVGQFEARLVVDRTIEDSEFVIRELALKLANLINQNTFESNVSPAKIKSIEPDGFKPELDAFLVWCVTWSHEFHVGENIWTNLDSTPFHKIIINGEKL